MEKRARPVAAAPSDGGARFGTGGLAGLLAAASDRRGGALTVYLLFAAVCCFLSLGAVPLISMEAMVADAGAAMIESGGWAVPTLYGEMFTFKPALAPWMSAVAQSAAERPGELLLRLPFALCGALLGLALLLLVGRRHGWRVGLFTGLAAVGSALFVEKVRIAEYDAPLAAAVGVAVAAAALNLAGRRELLSLWCLAYTGVAAGFVAKGAPALMVFGPGLVAAALLAGRPRRLAGWRHLAGGALGLLLIGGYLWWAWRSGGPQVFDQPLREAQVRGLRWGAAELLAIAVKPATTFSVLLPWSFALLLWRPFRRSASEDGLRLARAGAGFLLGGLAAFALLPASQPRYVLPLAGPLALVAGPIVATLLESRLPRWAVAATRVLFLLGAAATLGAAAGRGTPSRPLRLTRVARLSGAALAGRAPAGT
ncbi:MAG: glycosyltransferase family 39 protein, partial [Thermoanaerobaculia bacterium]|nr:glycosyltransferase family 39 protein [Thermoanaerobaculia bacterium]